MALNHLWVFLMAAAPIWELRGSIPTGIYALHLPWPEVFIISLLGNIFPVPFILLFLNPVSKFLSKNKFLEGILNWVLQRTRRQSALVVKYEKIGLMLFVAIPLPGTGAWSGALVAFLLGMGLKSALLSITLGVLIAGVIVLTLCLLGWLGALLAGGGLLLLAILGLWKI